MNSEPKTRQISNINTTLRKERKTETESDSVSDTSKQRRKRSSSRPRQSSVKQSKNLLNNNALDKKLVKPNARNTDRKSNEGKKSCKISSFRLVGLMGKFIFGRNKLSLGLKELAGEDNKTSAASDNYPSEVITNKDEASTDVDIDLDESIIEEHSKVNDNEISEKIDIDLNDPEVANSTAKIQASFKGKQARKEVEKIKEDKKQASKHKIEEEIDINLNDPEVANSAAKIQASFKGKQVRKEVAKMKEETIQNFSEGDLAKTETEEIEKKADEEIDIDLNDPEVANSAAKIQASFKGKQVRKEVAKKKEEQSQSNSEVNIVETETEEAEKKADEEIDIDLNDPEVANSAAKIQASFKGKQVRKEVAKLKEEKIQNPSKENDTDIDKGEAKIKAEEEIDIDLIDPEVANSAAKIQASFKGKQVRKEVAKLKEEHIQNASKENDTDIDTGEAKIKADEEIDIDLNDPEVANSAAKIQASFKRKQVRTEAAKMKEEQSQSNSEGNIVKTEKEEAEQKANEEIYIDLNDPEEADSAAKIQTSFKGKQARKEVAKMKEENEKDATIVKTDVNLNLKQAEPTECLKLEDWNPKETPQIFENAEEDISVRSSVNWEDPDINDTATNIQAGYRGWKVRDDMNKKEEERAATKIQTRYRGYQARKNLSKIRKEKNKNLKDNLEEPNEIIVADTSEYTEYDSETSYYYEDEDDESEILDERPKTPETSVAKFAEKTDSQDSTKLSGFKAIGMVARLMKKRKEKLDDERRQSIVSKDDSTMEKNLSKENQIAEIVPKEPTATERAAEQVSTTETTSKITTEDSDHEYTSDDFLNGDEELEDSDAETGSENEEECEEEEQVVQEDKKPFFLLKRLVGIMSLTGGPNIKTFKSNKVGILAEVKENSKEHEEQEETVPKPPAEILRSKIEGVEVVVTDVDG